MLDVGCRKLIEVNLTYPALRSWELWIFRSVFHEADPPQLYPTSIPGSHESWVELMRKMVSTEWVNNLRDCIALHGTRAHRSHIRFCPRTGQEPCTHQCKHIQTFFSYDKHALHMLLLSLLPLQLFGDRYSMLAYFANFDVPYQGKLPPSSLNWLRICRAPLPSNNSSAPSETPA